jgi:hypothetical protein
MFRGANRAADFAGLLRRKRICGESDGEGGSLAGTPGHLIGVSNRAVSSRNAARSGWNKILSETVFFEQINQ